MSFADVKKILNSFNETSKEFMGTCTTEEPDAGKRDAAQYNAVELELQKQKLREEQYQKTIEELRSALTDMQTNVARVHWLMADTRSLLNAKVDKCNTALVHVSICFATALVLLAIVVLFK